MLPDRFVSRPQEFPIAIGASVGKASLGGDLRRRCVQQAEPAGRLRAVRGKQPRVLGTGGVLQEEPAILGVRILEGPVVAERRDAQAGKNLLVDGALNEGV